MSEQRHINGKDYSGCVYDPESHHELKEVLVALKSVMENLDKHLMGVTTQLIGPATNRDYIPLSTHRHIVIFTVVVLGGIQAIKFFFDK